MRMPEKSRSWVDKRSSRSAVSSFGVIRGTFRIWEGGRGGIGRFGIELMFGLAVSLFGTTGWSAEACGTMHVTDDPSDIALIIGGESSRAICVPLTKKSSQHSSIVFGGWF